MNASWHYALFALISVVSIAWTLHHLRALGFSAVSRSIAFLITGLTVVPGLFLIRSAEDSERENLIKTVQGFAPVYARELEELGHSRVRIDTPADDPTYLELIEAQKRWLAVNPMAADIYSFHRLKDGSMSLWVDSETDYDRNGVFEGDREGRTTIGEPYAEENVSVELHAAYSGRPGFQSTIYTDRWGTWVSAFHPLRDAQGRVESVLGIDFPAAEWVTRLADARLYRVTQLLVGIGVILISTLMIARLNARLMGAQQQEQELKHSVSVAQLSERGKSEFLANMSHEMRTPLNGILGMTELLADTELDAQQRDFIATTRISACCLLELISNVLDLSKIEAGKLALENVPYSIGKLAQDVACIVRSNVGDKAIQIEANVAADVPMSLLGDPTRFKQILLNLGGNAVKFTERGRVQIEVSIVAGNEAKQELLVCVRDSGIGIAADKLQVIFQSFTQADASTTRRFGGSGLGLSIARELANAMGGRIEVKSELGVGSTFELRLPLSVSVAPAAPFAAVPAQPGESVTPTRGLRVLLVEDNAVNRKVLQATLARFECVVTSAENGQVAVGLARAQEFDAILMDCHMPVMDGYEATTRIRALEEPRNRTRIIALTANALAGDRERCIAAGMDDYVTKPVVRAELQAALARCSSLVEMAAGEPARDR